MVHANNTEEADMEKKEYKAQLAKAASEAELVTCESSCFNAI